MKGYLLPDSQLKVDCDMGCLKSKETDGGRQKILKVSAFRDIAIYLVMFLLFFHFSFNFKDLGYFNIEP